MMPGMPGMGMPQPMGGMMFNPQMGGGMGAPPNGKPGDWLCPSCGDHQFARNMQCRKCGEANPDKPEAAALPEGGKPGDWMCPQCGDHQFARNMQCRKCGAPNPSTGKGGSKGGKGG